MPEFNAQIRRPLELLVLSLLLGGDVSQSLPFNDLKLVMGAQVLLSLLSPEPGEQQVVIAYPNRNRQNVIICLSVVAPFLLVVHLSGHSALLVVPCVVFCAVIMQLDLLASPQDPTIRAWPVKPNKAQQNLQESLRLLPLELPELAEVADTYVRNHFSQLLLDDDSRTYWDQDKQHELLMEFLDDLTLFVLDQQVDTQHQQESSTELCSKLLYAMSNSEVQSNRVLWMKQLVDGASSKLGHDEAFMGQLEHLYEICKNLSQQACSNLAKTRQEFELEERTNRAFRHRDVILVRNDMYENHKPTFCVPGNVDTDTAERILARLLLSEKLPVQPLGSFFLEKEDGSQVRIEHSTRLGEAFGVESNKTVLVLRFGMFLRENTSKQARIIAQHETRDEGSDGVIPSPFPAASMETGSAVGFQGD